MARLILDTGVLIAAVRGRLGVDVLGAQDDVALPAVVIAEYLTGVFLASDEQQQAQRDFLEELLAAVPVVDYTSEVAAEHAQLLAHVRRAGRPRGAHDLIIAASARTTGRTLLTTDAQAHFDDLPGVDVRLV